mmetsp:Transcript_18605/g.54526  ORF Transcript_18605/g.54526 Transcript_18605/m.54526 type:complete len:267 (+) Transcript_18605:2255-3055(+)
MTPSPRGTSRWRRCSSEPPRSPTRRSSPTAFGLLRSGVTYGSSNSSWTWAFSSTCWTTRGGACCTTRLCPGPRPPCSFSRAQWRASRCATRGAGRPWCRRSRRTIWRPRRCSSKLAARSFPRNGARRSPPSPARRPLPCRCACSTSTPAFTSASPGARPKPRSWSPRSTSSTASSSLCATTSESSTVPTPPSTRASGVLWMLGSPITGSRTTMLMTTIPWSPTRMIPAARARHPEPTSAQASPPAPGTPGGTATMGPTSRGASCTP